MDAKKLLGQRVKELRKKKNLTQEQLSEKMNVYQKQIGNIETGTTFTTMTNLEKLAEILGVEIKDLFDFGYNKSSQDLIQDINSMLNSATEKEVQLVYKIVKDILL